MSADEVFFKIRMSADLHKELKEVSEVYRRSLTQEIIERLQASFKQSRSIPPELKDRIFKCAMNRNATPGQIYIEALETGLGQMEMDDEFAEIRKGQWRGDQADLQSLTDEEFEKVKQYVKELNINKKTPTRTKKK